MKNFKYTQEHIEWLRTRANKKIDKEICAEFNKTFNANKKIVNLRSCCAYYKLYDENINFKFKKEYVEWIKKNFFSVDETKKLHKVFNKHFKTDVSYDSFRRKCDYLGLQRGSHIWKKEELLFLKEHNDKYTKKELTQKFNEHFNLNLTVRQVRAECWHLGLSAVVDGRNIDNHKRVKLNTINTYHHNGREKLRIKVSDELHKGNNNWVPLERYIYEKETNVKVDPNDVILFLDNNCKNVNMDNLMLVSKRTAFLLNINNYAGYGQLTKAMAEVVSTQDEIKEMEKHG